MIDMNSTADAKARSSIVLLNNFKINYFDGVDARWVGVPKFLVGTSEDMEVVPLFVDGIVASRLNPPRGGASFVPRGFISNYGFAPNISAVILASDGVYVNSLEPASDGKFTNWKKIQTPAGMTEPFADWIAKKQDGFYSLKASADDITVCENIAESVVQITRNDADSSQMGFLAFQDLADAENSFILTTSREVLNSDRTVCQNPGNIAQLNVNGVSKIGNAFYAFVSSDDENVVYKTTGSPKTGTWAPTSEYNVFSNVCAGPVDFLTKFTNSNSHFKYNASRRDAVWTQLSNVAAVWDYETDSEVSSIHDIGFEYPECFNSDGNLAGFVGPDAAVSKPRLRTSAYELRLITSGFRTSPAMIKWAVDVGGRAFSFDMRGSLNVGGLSCAFGNIYAPGAQTRSVIVEVPSNRPNTVVDNGDGTYSRLFTFDHKDVYDLPEGVVINGPAVEFRENEFINEFVAVPALSSDNRQMVYIYEKDAVTAVYDWTDPTYRILFDEEDLPKDESLVVGDILFLDETLYATVFRYPSSDDVSVFSLDVLENFEDNLFRRAYDSHSIFNVVKDAVSNAAYVDFEAGSRRSLARYDYVGTLSFPFLERQTTASTPPETLLDYAVAYGATGLSAFASKTLQYYKVRESYKQANAEYNGLAGDSQFSMPDAKNVDLSSVWTFDFRGGISRKSFDNALFTGNNSIVAAVKPENMSVISHSTTPPTSFAASADDYGIISLRGFDGGSAPIRLNRVYVEDISQAATADGYFYATVRDVTDITYENTTPEEIDTNTWKWTASPVLGDLRYALYKLDQAGMTIMEVKSIPDEAEYGSTVKILGPDSWGFLSGEDKFPRVLGFEDWSIIKNEIMEFDPDNWTRVGTISVPGGSGKYIKFNDGKAMTWNNAKKLFLLDPDGRTSTSYDGAALFDGDIVALQNAGEQTVYVFTASASRSGQTCAVKIYSGPYSMFSSAWNPTLVAEVDGLDFFQNGSIYMTVGLTDEGEEVPKLIYSAVNGGIKSTTAKIKYNIVYGVLAAANGLSADGNVLKEAGAGILATGGDKLCSLVRTDNLVDGRWQSGFEITQISAGTGSLRDAFLNYATRNVSSYTLLKTNYTPALLELSADNARSIRNMTGTIPSVYDVAAEGATSYGGVRFYSSSGTAYMLSSTSYASTGTVSREVYNGKTLLSGMTYGFPTKEDIAEFGMSAYKGTLEEMHVPCFDVDLSSAEKPIFIDNLYSTVKLTDDFGQIYWVAAAQLDNRTSVIGEDERVHWTHYYQRYKLNELYDQPFKFTDVRDFSTPSAQTILVNQDGLVAYEAAPRVDWDVSHLRKIIREQAHLDNACESLGLHPDYTDVVKHIQTSPESNVFLLQSGHDIVLYTNWRHDIKYFGSCVPPYTMFNSRIQDAHVTNISKYGADDLNFVLGTSQGFLHLINGHLFAKAMYTDIDDNTKVLSGNCTYAGCYAIDNGTSIENRFLFTDGKSLYNVIEHDFNAKCEIDTAFKFSGEIINDIFRIGEGAYAICTNRGIYTSRPRLIIKDYLDDYMLSDLNNDIDMAFSRQLNQHVKDRHFAGSDMDVINHKIDKNFSPYPAGFTVASPVITSRHVLDVDNDLVESTEVRLTDDQAAINTSNVFAAVKNDVLTNGFTATRTYAPPGWFDHVVDINDKNHVVDYSDVRYICRRWRSGVVEFYIYIPTTFTYYFNNLAGYSQSPYAGLSLVRPNAGNLQIANDIKTMRTMLRLFISNTTYKLNTIYMTEIAGNSLPLKIYKDSTYCDSNRAGLFDTIVQPSVVRALPVMVGRSKNNVNPLMNASEQICLDFAIYGTDAQAIHIMAR